MPIAAADGKGQGEMRLFFRCFAGSWNSRGTKRRRIA